MRSIAYIVQAPRQAMRVLAVAALSLAGALPAARPAGAATLTTLFTFDGRTDGANPEAGVVFRDGALYGTNEFGGDLRRCAGRGCGTLFSLDLASGAVTTLYTFTGSEDGGHPLAGLTFDAAGTLYGTTSTGAGTGCGGKGCGTVFKFDPATGVLTTLHAFTGMAPDGGPSVAGLLLRNNALFGTTIGLQGTVFRLDLATGALTTLHMFDGADGAAPKAGVVFHNGALFGTTSAGGGSDKGTVFRLDLRTLALTTLHDFTGGAGGAHPEAGVVFGLLGALYGTTASGGPQPLDGTVFRLEPDTRSFTTLHVFSGAEDGARPRGGLIFRNRALFGTTYMGGVLPSGESGTGTVFELNPATQSLYTLHTFGHVLPGGSTDGDNPRGGLAFSGDAFYGTTMNGGQRSAVGTAGTVFQLVP